MRLIRIILVVALSTVCVHAQTVTLSPQGSGALVQLAGRSIKGFQLVALDICTDVPLSVSGGIVYRAATRAGFAWEAPEVAQVQLERTSNLNWRNVTVSTIVIGSTAAAMMISGGVIAASGPWVTALIAGHGLADQVSGLIKSHAPDPRNVTALLLRVEDSIELNVNQCKHGFIGAAYPGPKGAVTVPLFDIPTVLSGGGWSNAESVRGSIPEGAMIRNLLGREEDPEEQPRVVAPFVPWEWTAPSWVEGVRIPWDPMAPAHAFSVRISTNLEAAINITSTPAFDVSGDVWYLVAQNRGNPYGD